MSATVSILIIRRGWNTVLFKMSAWGLGLAVTSCVMTCLIGDAADTYIIRF